LTAGLNDTARGEQLLEMAESEIADSQISARSLVVVAHRVSQGIADVAESEDCNLIILSRKRSSSFLERYSSAAMRTVLRDAPVEVIFIHGEIPKQGIRKIVLPFGENIHTRLAVELAPALTEYYQSELHITVVVPPDISPEERSAMVNNVEQILQQRCPFAVLDLVEDSDVVRGVIRQAKDADLVLMGGRSGTLLEMLAASSVTEDITQQLTCPVIWAEEYEESESMLARLMKPPEPETEM
jgi:nucleotide-binding universal stress UspA family protein